MLGFEKMKNAYESSQTWTTFEKPSYALTLVLDKDQGLIDI